MPGRMKVNVVRFGTDSKRVHHFENVGSSTNNFGGVVTSTTRLPGMDGTFDNYGDGDAASEGGDVRVQFHLATQFEKQMTALRDLVNRMKPWGKRPLWMQPSDPSDPIRWCSARVNNTNLSENAKEGTDWLQPATINFQVSFPRWQSRPNVNYLGQSYLDGTVALVASPPTYLDGQTNLGSGNLSIPRCLAYVKNGTQLRLLNYGDAPAPARIKFMASRPWYLNEGLHFGDPGVMIGAYGSVSVRYPSVKRLNDYGDVIEQWRWENTLGINEVLEVDAKSYKVLLRQYPNNTISGYPEFVPVKSDGFIVMEPGINTLMVEGEFGGPFGFLEVDYWDSYY